MIMAIIRKKELKSMGNDALTAKLSDVRRELYSERGLIASGGRSSNPGKIKELKRTVARILTYLSQKVEVGAAKPNEKKSAPAQAKTAKPAAGKV